jgi:hypothetical protein
MFVSLLFIFFGLGWCLDHNYANQRKLKCQLSSIDDIKILHLLQEESDQIDLWDEDIDQLPATVVLRIDESLVENISKLFVCEKPVEIFPRETGVWGFEKEVVTPNNFFNNYRSYDEIVTWINNLPKRNMTRVMRVDNMGKSGEGRDMPVVILGKPGGIMRRNLWVSGGQHAREWIAIAACLYLIEKVNQELISSIGYRSRRSSYRIYFGQI